LAESAHQSRREALEALLGGVGREADAQGRLAAVQALVATWEAQAGHGPRWGHAHDLLQALGDVLAGRPPRGPKKPENREDLTIRALAKGQAIKPSHAVIYLGQHRIGTCWKGRDGWWAEADRFELPPGQPPVPLQAATRQEAAEKLAQEVLAKG
jgi:hypothetical protein